MYDDIETRFWDKFIEKTTAYNVKPNVARWYVRHAETYIKFHSNLRLSQHSPEHIEEYLKEKGRNAHIQDWQFMQIIESLKIILEEMVNLPWVKRTPVG